MANPQWQRILAAGLCPGIHTFEDYKRRFVKQLNQAFENVSAYPDQVPDKTYIKSIHKTIFEDIYPWAGQFRKLGNVVTFDGGTLGTDPQAIRAELDRIRYDTQLSLQMAATDQDKAIAITVYQARLRRCHPFLDGNTRTGSCLLQGQVLAVFGTEIPILRSEQHHCSNSSWRSPTEESSPLLRIT